MPPPDGFSRVALEGVRADATPDEHQAQQIRWLDEALAEMEK